MTRRRAGICVALLVLCIAIGVVLAGRYISRLPNHAGYFLVAVDDAVRAPMATPRPRVTAVIVVDGLRLDAAETMSQVQRLRDAGQCRTSDQGTYTVSRPEYALLSTGLEVDRTGARNNENAAPLAAESVWQIARRNGLRVSGSSHLPWFRELFPDGFDRFLLARSHEDDVFAVPDLYDLNLFHPLYVDEAGHQRGAASPEYAAAVARADREIKTLLDRLDLTRDLVVFTADHGHRDAGGHGGAQPEIRYVLACFAGANVAQRAGAAPFDGRSTAPGLALLLGLPFPRHMRAGDDGLDAIWEVMKDDASNAAYRDDRRAAIERFRAENRASLERALVGGPGTWPRLYERESDAQWRRIFLVVAAAIALLGVRVRQVARVDGIRAAVTTVAWLALTTLVVWAVHHLVLGDFDYTVINLRSRFLPRAFAIVALSALVAGGVRFAFERKLERLARDFTTLVLLLLFANLGHVFVYGWPLGFPLPGAAARYLPFFGGIALVGFGVVTLIIVAGALGVARCRERTRRGHGRHLTNA